MKIELKHLAPYLPYGLKCINIGNKVVRELVHELGHDSEIKRKIGLTMILGTSHINKPILRPLSDFVKDEFHEQLGEIHLLHDETIIAWSVFDGESLLSNKMDYSFYEWLFKNHFDVFGLIEKGLAIDINQY